jgi:glyoxylase-like metal-dependent hydrolase (beta-lactamase superfamily II)
VYRAPNRRILALLAAVMCGAAGCRLGAASPGTRQAAADTTYEVLAVRFATLPAFPVRRLVAGADSSRLLDIAMMVWALRAPSGRIVLVDAGFHRQRFIDQWRPRDYQTPLQALRRAGIDPGDVTDVIVSHVHWDHADGVELFPDARVWLQEEEFTYYVGPEGEVLHAGIDRDVAGVFRRLFQARRLRLAAPDEEVLPGIRVHTGGKHTFASQFVSVRTTSGCVVLASDNAYLYENLERRVPIAQTLDPASNLRAQARMLELASHARLVVPGHDPGVFTRFRTLSDGVAEIR